MNPLFKHFSQDSKGLCVAWHDPRIDGLNGHRLYFIISLFKATYKSTIQVSRNFHALFTKTLENSETAIGARLCLFHPRADEARVPPEQRTGLSECHQLAGPFITSSPQHAPRHLQGPVLKAFRTHWASEKFIFKDRDARFSLRSPVLRLGKFILHGLAQSTRPRDRAREMSRVSSSIPAESAQTKKLGDMLANASV